MASSPGNPSMMPNSTASSFNPVPPDRRTGWPTNRLVRDLPSPKPKLRSVRFLHHAQYRTEALPAHVPVNAHQKVGPVHVEKLITLALQGAPAPGLEFRGGSPHAARDLLGVVLMPQVLLRNPRQIPGRQSRQKSFR